MRSQSASRLLLIFPLIFLLGCARQYSTPVFDPDDVGFKGFLQQRASRLVFIHGMCNHGSQWFDSNVGELEAHYGLKREQEHPERLTRDESLVQLYRISLKGHEREVDAFGIVYSRATAGMKRENLCYDMTRQRSVVCEAGDMRPCAERRKRAWANAWTKDKLMNDCLADAVIYFGKAGQDIRNGVSQAIKLIAEYYKDSANSHLSQAPLFYISESLGSKVLADTLICDTSLYQDKHYLQLLGSTTHVFMFANQIPLMNTGYVPGNCDAEGSYLNKLKKKKHAISDSSFRHFLELVNEKREELGLFKNRGVDRLKVVAFTDPNDLLSYELRPQDFSGMSQHLNVIHSNRATVLGLFENPYTAHTTYGLNSEVVKLIACGHLTQAGADDLLECPPQDE